MTQVRRSTTKMSIDVLVADDIPGCPKTQKEWDDALRMVREDERYMVEDWDIRAAHQIDARKQKEITNYVVSYIGTLRPNKNNLRKGSEREIEKRYADAYAKHKVDLVKVQTWLQEYSQYSYMFGESNTTVPKPNRVESTRKIVHDAKELFFLSITKEKLRASSRFRAQNNDKRSRLEVTTRTHIPGDQGAVSSQQVETALQDRVLISPYQNIRVLEQTTLETITRVPFTKTLSVSPPTDSQGLRGEHISLPKLLDAISEGLEESVLAEWVRHRKALFLGSKLSTVADESTFKAAIVDFTRGPRNNREFVVAILTTPHAQNDTGKYS